MAFTLKRSNESSIAQKICFVPRTVPVGQGKTPKARSPKPAAAKPEA
jgi:hypothetical protein